MCSALDDLPCLHDQDLVGAPDGREPVRNHERGATLHQVAQACWIMRLDSESRRGGLVQDQDARVGEDRARDRHPLPLAAGELHAALTHDGLVAIREALGELIHPRNAQAFRNCSSVASGREKITFSRMVPSNRKDSCSTTPSWLR